MKSDLCASASLPPIRFGIELNAGHFPRVPPRPPPGAAKEVVRSEEIRESPPISPISSTPPGG